MKNTQVINQIPTVADLEGAYEFLQFCHYNEPGKQAHTLEQRLAIYSNWARFDARLAQILVRFFAENWPSIDANSLNAALRLQQWPRALGPILDFVSLEFKGELREALKEQKKISSSPFAQFKRAAMFGFTRARLADSASQYFIGQRAFGGRLMQQDAEFSLKIYRRWGFVSRENLLPQKARSARPSATLLDADQRRRCLDALLKTQFRITARQYRLALDNQVSVRQAELDLSNHPRLKPMGRTKGRSYVRGK